MEEHHLTRAAARVGLSQSGMSNALARLRDLIGDPLFVRSASGMRPTRVALELGPPLQQALDLIEATLARNRFDPSTSDRKFVLAMPDAIEGLFLGPLLARMGTAAPNVRIAVVPLETTRPSTDLLRSGADLAVGAIHEGSWVHEALYVEGFQVLFDPAIRDERMTLARYCARPHVVWNRSGELIGNVDGLLAARGRRRRVLAATSNFLAVPHLVRGSERMATLPSRIARMLAREHDLATARVPIGVPEFEIRMAWDPAWDADEGAGWLRDEVRAVAAEL